MLGGLRSAAISGSSKIPLVQKLLSKGGGDKAGSSNYLGHPVPLIRGEFSKVDYGIKKEKSADLRLRDAQPARIVAKYCPKTRPVLFNS